jgi:hypothetical protein
MIHFIFIRIFVLIFHIILYAAARLVYVYLDLSAVQIGLLVTKVFSVFKYFSKKKT